MHIRDCSVLAGMAWWLGYIIDFSRNELETLRLTIILCKTLHKSFHCWAVLSMSATRPAAKPSFSTAGSACQRNRGNNHIYCLKYPTSVWFLQIGVTTKFRFCLKLGLFDRTFYADHFRSWFLIVKHSLGELFVLKVRIGSTFAKKEDRLNVTWLYHVTWRQRVCLESAHVQTAHGTTTEPGGLGKCGARDLESMPCAVSTCADSRHTSIFKNSRRYVFAAKAARQRQR